MRSLTRKRAGAILPGLGLVFLLLLPCLAGCSPLIKAEQPARADSFSITSGSPIGQTFVARFDGLSGMAVDLRIQEATAGAAHFHLRSSPQDTHDLASLVVPLQKLTGQGFQRFSFPTQNDSAGQNYYILLELEGDGRLLAGSAPGSSYLSGALYQDDYPEDAQLTFQLLYAPVPLALGLLKEGISWLALLAAAAFLFVLPGWALLNLLLPAWPRLGWLEKSALAAGTGLAFYPVLILWADLAGLHLGRLFAWLPPLASLGVLAWKNRSGRAHIREKRKETSPARDQASLGKVLPDLVAVAVLAMIFGTRFWAVRGLEAPMWGDSYQHNMIAQLILDHGGLFNSWEPYTPYRSLTVQFGFPVMIAALNWLAGIPSVPGTLIGGQMINGLAIFSLYPLAIRMSGGSRWSGAGALLAAGLLSPMPAAYVNWGRYAQLAGLAILPVAAWLAWEVLECSLPACARRAGPVFLAALVITGMTLSYYRTPFFFAAFLLLLLLWTGFLHWRRDPRGWMAGVARLALVGIIALLLFLPWAPRLSGSNLAGVVEGGLKASTPVQQVQADFQAWSEVEVYAPPLLLALAGGGWLLAVLSRRWLLALLPLWPGLLAAYVAGQLYRVPGANMLQNFAILIALYLPIGLLAGYLLGSLAEAITLWRGRGRAGEHTYRRQLHFSQAEPVAAAMALLALAGWGAVSQRAAARPDLYALVTRPDGLAMAWIRENTPPDARFLVEGFLIWGGISAVGSDAGWWIPLLANRENTMPPQYALLNETPSSDGYTQDVVKLVAILEALPPDAPESLERLCAWGITHIYVGQRQGLVGAGAVQLFSPEELATSPVFRAVYQQDLVKVFALDPQICMQTQ